MKQSADWFILSNSDGIVLGVYGSALHDMATERGKAIKAEFPCCGIALHSITTKDRPFVGQSVSMKGNIEWF